MFKPVMKLAEFGGGIRTINCRIPFYEGMRSVYDDAKRLATGILNDTTVDVIKV